LDLNKFKNNGGIIISKTNHSLTHTLTLMSSDYLSINFSENFFGQEKRFGFGSGPKLYNKINDQKIIVLPNNQKSIIFGFSS
jgi:hypothetical protein